MKLTNKVGKVTLLALSSSLILVVGAWSVAHAAKPTSSMSGLDAGESDFQHHIFARIQNRLFRVIGASDDQKEKLTGILNNTFEQNAVLRKDLKTRVLALSSAYADDTVSNDQIKVQVTEINELRAKLMTRRVDALIEARGVLSASQRKTLATRVNERVGDN